MTLQSGEPLSTGSVFGSGSIMREQGWRVERYELIGERYLPLAGLRLFDEQDVFVVRFDDFGFHNLFAIDKEHIGYF